MADRITNNDDIIDSRDVEERIEELQDQIEDGESLSPDEQEELESLKALRDDVAQYTEEWRHGLALIRETYFTEYAQQMAEDIGAIDPNASWPLDCINWDKAARELRMDYSETEFDGVTYLFRD